MGLRFPEDLDAWQRWQDRRNLLRTAKTRLRAALKRDATEQTPEFVLHVRGDSPRLLTALETTTPTKLAALVRPLEFLEDEDLAVLAPDDVAAHLPGTGWRTLRVPGTREGLDAAGLETVEAVLGVGHYLPVGRAVDAWRTARGLRFWVVQHGLLVPVVPPLPHDAGLFAFSAADGAFWASGRTDVEIRPVGSQLLWSASRRPRTEAAAEERPVFLGQLHGAELNRAVLAVSCYVFCRRHGALYRPHPGETDVVSRLVQRLWKAAGLEFADTSVPLAEVTAPVVSTFSTGILEAAATGGRAWAYHLVPPRWLREFWERYGISRWGEDPTPAPPVPETEPARAVAEHLRSL